LLARAFFYLERGQSDTHTVTDATDHSAHGSATGGGGVSNEKVTTLSTKVIDDGRLHLRRSTHDI